MEFIHLKGVIDTHVHSAPDIRERKMTDLALMEAAVRYGVRSIVIKGHAMPTAGRAALVNEVRREKYPDSDFEMFGGVVLNSQMGGINVKAAEAALRIGGKIIWLPTFDSSFTMERAGRSGGVPVVKDGKVTKEVRDVIRLAAEYGAVLATGHISPKEIFLVAEAACDLGLRKVIVNHPESNLVGLSIEEMKRLAEDYGVFLEHCYQQPVGGGIYESNEEITLRSIREIGAEHIIIATDAGQKQNPWWYEEMEDSIVRLLRRGITEEELDRMTKTNPAFVLGL